MQQNNLTLTHKKELTHDVYELIYRSEKDIQIQPGQFLLCDCKQDDPKMKRSYSISYAKDKEIEFIIKRLENGTGGSKAICDQEIGHNMSTMGPMGHFVLKNTDKKKVFIGTGTGFAPLYFQIRAQIEKKPLPINFIFGVRNESDIFYEQELRSLQEEQNDFNYQLCLSKPEGSKKDFYQGYVTGYLASHFEKYSNSEFYICGSPAMVKDVRSYLEQKEIAKEDIYFEQY